jgi:hypothetical protein
MFCFIPFVRLSFPYWLIPNFDKERTAGVIGQQRMLTPPRHLILPLNLSRVEIRVALHLILYLLFGL